MNTPFTWFKNRVGLSIKGDAEIDPEIELYSRITDVFDPRIINPYNDHSKCINIR